MITNQPDVSCFAPKPSRDTPEGGSSDKSIDILFEISLINGVLTEIIFCFVFKLLIVAYVEDAVDDNK